MGPSGLMPGSQAIAYGFRFAELADSTVVLGGSSKAAITSDGRLELSLADDMLVGELDESRYQAAQLVLTYLHEQFHRRHLAASPFGLALWVLQAQEYVQVAKALRVWGESVAGDAVQPVYVESSANPQVRAIDQTKRICSVFYQCLRQGDTIPMTLFCEQVMPEVAARLEAFCARTLGVATQTPKWTVALPSMSTLALDKLGCAPTKVLNTDAVLEGLARANEFLVMITMGAEVDTLNRTLLEKSHGIYRSCLAFAEHVLQIKPPRSWLVTARLLDWAFQAPLLPLLWQGRESIPVFELLPCWRFTLLLAKCKSIGIDIDAVEAGAREPETTLFAEMGWESPTQIATRIAQLSLPEKLAVQTGMQVQNFASGAKLRLADAHPLALPVGNELTVQLERGINFFADGTVASSGEMSINERVLLAHQLLEDNLIDTVWVHDSLRAPRRLAEHIANAGLVPKSVSGPALLSAKLGGLVGTVAASRLLENSAP